MKTTSHLPLRSLVTTCLMLLATMSAFADDFSITNDGVTLSYDITDKTNKTVKLVGSSLDGSRDVVIPSTVEYGGTTYTVTATGTRVFFQNSNLTSITIPETVTSIAEYLCYNCSALETVNFNAVACTEAGSVSGSVYYCAISSCTALKNINIGEKVTLIPGTLCSGCPGITSITIPENVTSIGECAFINCTGLTTINLNAVACTTVGSSGNPGFYVCSAIKELNIGEKVTMLPSCLLYNRAAVTSVTIPRSVTSIGDYTFFGCTGLTEISLPEGVTSIGEYAFYNCTGLSSMALPGNLTSIGNRAFYYCSGLTSVGMGEKLTTIGVAAFAYCSSLSSVTLPNSLTSIGGNVFQNCYGLTDVTLPEGLTSLADAFFQDCTSLSGINIPDGVTSVGNNTFYGCYSLKSISLPDGVTSIGDKAFQACSALTSIVIPDGVTSIGNNAFYDCAGLESVTLSGSLTSIGSGAFYQCTNLQSLTLPEGVNFIGSQAFQSCTSLSSINIPEGVTSINNQTFMECYSLSSISLPNSVTSIGDYAFYLCNKMSSVSVGDNLTFIGGNAFCNCSALTSLTLPDGVTTIGSGAFDSCIELVSINIPDGVTTIGDYTFYNCRNLTSINIPDGVDSIGDYAFYNNTSVTDIYSHPGNPAMLQSNTFTSTYNATVHVPTGCADVYKAADYWGNFANFTDDLVLSTFKDNGVRCRITDPDRLEAEVVSDADYTGKVTIPETVGCGGKTYTVTAIADSAFLNCTGMTSITIGESVTSIGQNAFSGCTGLVHVICNSTTPPTLSSTAFDTSTYSSATLYVPEGSENTYKAADYWSNFTNINVEDNLEDGIYTPAELLAIANDLSGDYKLAADIDMSGIDFTPMGEFTGTLDGRGHVIKNLTYDNADTDNVGLFSTARGATVKNLGIQGARIVGNANAGGFIGRMYGGTITNCFLLDSYVEGSDHVGSILGFLDNNSGALSTMSDCASDSRIKTRSYQVGGMAGVMHGGTLERCLFTGTVEGSSTHVSGLVSLIDAATYANTIQNNMSAPAHAYGNSDPSDLIVYTASRSVTLKNNYVLSSTFTDENGSTVGSDNSNANGVAGGKTDDATARSKDFYANTLGWDFDSTWTFVGGTEGCMYPVLQVMPTPLATRIYDVPTDTVLYADLSETLNLNLGHGSWGQELSYEITSGADLATLSDGVLTPNSDAAGSGYVTVVASFPEAASAVLDPGSIEIKVLVGTTTGIGEVDSAADAAPAEPAYYSLDGRRLSAPRKGVNIVRLSDGTVKKVLMK